MEIVLTDEEIKELENLEEIELEEIEDDTYVENHEVVE